MLIHSARFCRVFAAGLAMSLASSAWSQPSAQDFTYQAGGNINLGATLAIGKVYVLSTAGAICPVDDIAGSEFVTVLGIATTTALLKQGIVVGGVAAAGAVS